MFNFRLLTKEDLAQQLRAEADYVSVMKRYGTPPSVWLERQEEGAYSPAEDESILRRLRRVYRKWSRLPKQVAKEAGKSIKWLKKNYPAPFSYHSKRVKERLEQWGGGSELASELAVARSVLAYVSGFLDGETGSERWKRYSKIPHDVHLLEKTKCDMCRHCGEEFLHRSYVRLTFCTPECALRDRVDRQRKKRNADKPTEATCYHCGATYKPQRSTSRYCSAKCRVYASRDRERGE